MHHARRRVAQQMTTAGHGMSCQRRVPFGWLRSCAQAWDHVDVRAAQSP